MAELPLLRSGPSWPEAFIRENLSQHGFCRYLLFENSFHYRCCTFEAFQLPSTLIDKNLSVCFRLMRVRLRDPRQARWRMTDDGWRIDHLIIAPLGDRSTLVSFPSRPRGARAGTSQHKHSVSNGRTSVSLWQVRLETNLVRFSLNRVSAVTKTIDSKSGSFFFLLFLCRWGEQQSPEFAENRTGDLPLCHWKTSSYPLKSIHLYYLA